MVRRYLAVLMAIVMSTSYAWSWGSATHKFINKEAAIHLPPSFPFFANNIQWISDHAADADNRKGSDPTESPKHFIDIEDYPEFAAGTLSHNYDTLVAKHGLGTVTSIGTVPWAIIWSFDSLTNCLRRGDSARALQFAADLGHYVGDAHQPLHVTNNYDGQKTGNGGVHARYESTMLQSYNYLNQVTVVARQAHFIPDPIDTNFAFVYHGNGLVDSILHADTYAKSIDSKYGSAYYAALWQETGAMTQNQIQDASVDLANLWYTAAIEAGLVPDSSAVIAMSATPSSITFGSVRLGSFKDTTLTLLNTGADSLTIASIVSSDSLFSVRTAGAILAPGQALVDTVRFSPAAAGTAQAKIVITSNAISSPDTILLTGIGKSTTGIVNSQPGLPQRFELSQNFPNPFNPSTMIRYSLPYRSLVRIQIYNVIGQLVAEPVSGEQSAGYREVLWTAALPSGMYFCRIEASSLEDPVSKFIDVKKMVLLK